MYNEPGLAAADLRMRGRDQLRSTDFLISLG
jgi:hypothetical protein